MQGILNPIECILISLDFISRSSFFRSSLFRSSFPAFLFSALLFSALLFSALSFRSSFFRSSFSVLPFPLFFFRSSFSVLSFRSSFFALPSRSLFFLRHRDNMTVEMRDEYTETASEEKRIFLLNMKHYHQMLQVRHLTNHKCFGITVPTQPNTAQHSPTKPNTVQPTHTSRLFFVLCFSERRSTLPATASVREICIYCTCWWYSLCNFQYRQQYENTCSYNFEC